MSFFKLSKLYHQRNMILWCTKLNLAWNTKNKAEGETDLPPPLTSETWLQMAQDLLCSCSTVDCFNENHLCTNVQSCHQAQVITKWLNCYWNTTSLSMNYCLSRRPQYDASSLSERLLHLWPLIHWSKWHLTPLLLALLGEKSSCWCRRWMLL